MERIKKALEIAQKQRQGSTPHQQQSAINSNDFDSTTETQNIAYLQTRNIDVTDDFLKQNRIIAGFDEDTRSYIYKILRTKILQKMQANNWNLLAISSPTRGAGTSITAINLAISMAMDPNYSVLLVDLDLRNPSIHDYFGIPAEPGLSDYFSGKKTIAELLVHPCQEKMVILPAGKAIQRSSDLLSTPKMQKLVNDLKHRYSDRIIIVDLPPLLKTDDALIFLPNADACVLVVAEGESNIEDVKKSIQLIQKEKYLGSILTKSAEGTLANETL
jgi:capsular exopolysaccharide synthesis family protein